jgi:hypothetical protein
MYGKLLLYLELKNYFPDFIGIFKYNKQHTYYVKIHGFRIASTNAHIHSMNYYIEYDIVPVSPPFLPISA